VHFYSQQYLYYFATYHIKYTGICIIYERHLFLNCNVFISHVKNICYDIKIECQYNIEICSILSQIYLYENIIIVGSVTTCRGQGYIVAAHYTLHSLLLLKLFYTALVTLLQLKLTFALACNSVVSCHCSPFCATKKSG